jgi:hypothetical protein
MKIHGYYGTPTYRSWIAMVVRCENPKHVHHLRYAKIKIHPPWRESFLNFIKDVGERANGTTLDRFPDPSGNYVPGNVRWATPKQQSRNTKANKLINFNGENITAAEWSEKTGIGYSTIRERIKCGWSIAEALTLPVSKTRRAYREAPSASKSEDNLSSAPCLIR